MPTLHIFVIHTQQLKVRAMHIHDVVQKVRLAAIAEKYDVNIRLILSPDASHIEEKIADYQNEINYDSVNNPIFDNFRVILSSEMLSNSIKHLDVWKRITEKQQKLSSTEDLFLVLEDDAFAVPDITNTFRELLKTAKQHVNDWDILMLGLTTNEPASTPMTLSSLSSITNVLPCKESYLIKPATAQRCLQDWKKHKFIMRIQWSYWLSQNSDVKVCVPSKRVFLDSSKLGIMPSSIHGNNMLIFNREFVEMTKMVNLPENEIQQKLKVIEQLYTSVMHMNSPDIMHIYGVLLFKCGKYAEAKKMFTSAMEVLKLHHCRIHSQGDLYQNLVKMHEQMQNDIVDITSQPSHYDNVQMANSDLCAS